MKTVFRVLLLAVFVGGPIALHTLPVRPPVATADPAVTREVDTRFAIRYCSSQYRAQIDLDYCLAKLLPARSA